MPRACRSRTIRAGLACAVVLGLAGCQSGPRTCNLARAAELPLRLESGHLMVDAVLNGTPTNLILDTGSDATVIAMQVAQRLSLPLLPAGRFEGVGGSNNVFTFVTSSFQLGALHGTRLHLAASDMNMVGGNGAVPPDGLLGDNFLSEYDLDLDLQRGRAVLYVASPACARPTTAMGGPLYVAPMLRRPQNDLHPVVQVAIDGQMFSAAVDTGAPHSVIFADAAHRIGLDIARLDRDFHFRAFGVGPTSPAAVRHVVTAMRIGDVTISNLPVAIIDQPSVRGVDMLLGLDFLVRVHAWFSFSSRTLIMQYPPQPSTATGMLDERGHDAS